MYIGLGCVKHFYMGGWSTGQMSVQMNGLMNSGQINDEFITAQMICMRGWMDYWINGRMDELISGQNE